MIPFAVFVAVHASQVPSLDELQKVFDKCSVAPNFDPSKLQEITQSVISLIEGDKITASGDFYRASKLIADWQSSFEISRVKHELCLAALASGDVKARAEVKNTWDNFLMSTGREQRVGTMIVPGVDHYAVSPAPKSVRNVLQDPEKAKAISDKAKSDAEVTKICADDQAAREGDFSKFTAKQMNDMAVGDKKRLARIIQLLEAGRVVTSEDFDHASLVLQHGSSWRNYSLAHELSICTLLLDSKQSPWLAAATYDRMLESGGYRQRFGTQYKSFGNSGFKLGLVDTTGIGDAVRKVMHCPTLEEAKNKKWD